MSLQTGFSILGVAALKKKVQKLHNAAVTQVKREIAEGTLRIAGQAVKDIASISPGSQSQIRYGAKGASGKSGKRVALVSPAGQPPNSDTGSLARSIQIKIEDDGFKGSVGTELKYGFWLEFGTNKMAARPYLRPAFKLHEPEILRNCEDHLKKAIQKIARSK